MARTNQSEDRWTVTAKGERLLGGMARPQASAHFVPDPNVVLPNYDRGELGGSTVDVMPDYDAGDAPTIYDC